MNARSKAGSGRRTLLGVQVDPVVSEELRDAIMAGIQARKRMIVGNHNLHSIYLFRHDAQFRAFFADADIVYIDGFPLVVASWLGARPLAPAKRTTFIDWAPTLLDEAAANSWRVFFLGSREEVLERGLSALRLRHPGLQIAGSHGYFDVDGPANQEVLLRIREWRPALLFVGMGMPRQERWILANADRLAPMVIVSVGGCMDILGGAIATPPRWLGRCGLEWAYLLLAAPRRGVNRYLVEPLLLLRDFISPSNR